MFRNEKLLNVYNYYDQFRNGSHSPRHYFQIAHEVKNTLKFF